jgi:NADH-quinone oxidoreductase subunit L
MAEVFSWLILLLPLLAAAIITLFVRGNQELSARFSIGAVVVGFWLSIFLLADNRVAVKAVETGFSWLAVGDLHVEFGLRLDRLSLLMLLVVTAVGGAIQIYSYDYMRGDRGFSRYFACMSLFTFAMLGVVLATNFVQLFIFWELVGLSSYLLIGFWYEKPAAAEAAKKAFLTNRLGDWGFLLGILLLWATLGTVQFQEIQSKLAANPHALLELSTLIGLLVFCGAVGKSAQFPLHVWLPDAMEGPTPVSALIHAATMVAAGVFMLCRVFFIFTASAQLPGIFAGLDVSALEVIAGIGLFTALLSSVMAAQQNDIKRILAYSTLSQLGYMVLAVGLNGPDAAMYHLTTHAFFKALLFLGAGAIILALHHEQDIWKMGALRSQMPWTFRLFLLASLALCGMPPLSGFFSKEAILTLAYEKNTAVFALTLLGAALTTFYMFRLILVVFIRPLQNKAVAGARDPSQVMLWPMMFLAVPAAVLGFWGVDHRLALFFSQDLNAPHLPWYETLVAPFGHGPVGILGLAALACGFAAAWGLYHRAQRDPLMDQFKTAMQWVQNRFYIDEFYECLVRNSQDALARAADFSDRWIIAGVGVRGLHGTVELAGRLLRLFQTGNLQTYALWFTLGILLLLYFTAITR